MADLAIEQVTEVRSESGFPRWELAQWAEMGFVAGITAGGAGDDPGLWNSSNPATSRAALLALQESWGNSFQGIVLSEQVHGREVAAPRRADGPVFDGTRDGHVTAEPGVLLAITVADCVPVYLAAPESGSIALLHCGWKGLAAGILRAGIKGILGLGVASTSNIVMHCGVSICGACYEVGSEVVQEVTGVSTTGNSLLDLRAELCRRARNFGINRVTVSPRCTFHDYPAFFSYRRSGGASGRMVAFLGVPNA